MFNHNSVKGLLMGISLAFLCAAATFLLFFDAANARHRNIKAEPYGEPTHQLDSSARSSASSPLVIPAAAFYNWGPPGPTVPYGQFFPSDGYITTNAFEATACWMAPVYLPDGAEITSFTAYVYNRYQIVDFDVNLRQKVISNTNSSELLSQAKVTNQEYYVQIITGTAIVSTTAIVDNSTFSYYVDTCLLQNHRLYAVEIAFINKTYLPVVMNNFCPFWWECEPNDTPALAHGPLVSGDTYYGNPDDHGSDIDSDYFYINLADAGPIHIYVTNFAIRGQVQLHKDPPDFNNPLDKCADPIETGICDFTHTPESGGKYYIRVVSAPADREANGNYALTVTFK